MIKARETKFKNSKAPPTFWRLVVWWVSKFGRGWWFLLKVKALPQKRIIAVKVLKKNVYLPLFSNAYKEGATMSRQLQYFLSSSRLSRAGLQILKTRKTFPPAPFALLLLLWNLPTPTVVIILSVATVCLSGVTCLTLVPFARESFISYATCTKQERRPRY